MNPTIVSAHPPWFSSEPLAPSSRPETVAVVIPVKTPNMAYLDWTLGTLETQTHRPTEVFIVDCGVPPVEIDSNLPVQVIQSDVCNTATQRALGLTLATAEYVLHLDEDAILANPRHIERQLGHFDEPGVAGVGGIIQPLTDSVTGRLGAAITQWRGHFPMHQRSACAHADCFPDRQVGRFFNEDQTLRATLEAQGEIRVDETLVVLTDLPTKKQRTGLFAIGAGVAYLLL